MIASDAQLAMGLIRAQGIPCEAGPRDPEAPAGDWWIYGGPNPLAPQDWSELGTRLLAVSGAGSHSGSTTPDPWQQGQGTVTPGSSLIDLSRTSLEYRPTSSSVPTMANTVEAELYCPPEWVELVEKAMADALPGARSEGPDSVRVGLMIRQSKAREDDSHGSPRAQLEGGLHLIQSPAHDRWYVNPHHVFADIGVSGWAPGVKRPGYDGMMSVVRAGKLDVLVVWSLARLSRKGALDVLSVIAEFAKHGVRLVSVTEPWLDTDPNNPVGQAILGLTAALAQQESAQKSLHITATLAEVRKRGGHVTGKAPYGTKTERVMVDGIKVNKLVPDLGEPAEPKPGDYVLQMVHWAKNEKLDDRSIAEKLTERAIPTPTGKDVWIAQTVRGILRDPRLAGYSVEAHSRVETDAEGHKKRRPITQDHAIMYGPDGEPVELHEGLIPREVWWDLQLERGRDASKVRVRNPRTHHEAIGLFTRLQLLRCNVCGRPCQTNPGTGKMKYPFYTCNSGPGGPLGAGKHSLGISLAQVDDLIPRAAFQWLAKLNPDNPDDLEILAEVSDRFTRQAETAEHEERMRVAQTELGHVQAALKTLAEDREAGDYDGPTMTAIYRSNNKRLRATEAKLLATVTELGRPGTAAIKLPHEWFDLDLDPIGPNSAWAGWDSDKRRAFLLTVLDGVSVSPARVDGVSLSVPERLNPMWARPAEED